MSKLGVLLVNLGSPDSTSVADVRAYLREFLSDDRVLDMPKWWQQIVLNLFILPTRPAKSAEAYREIWTDEGSPLVVSTARITELLRKRTELPVAMGMRYGTPSTHAGVKELIDQNVDQILLVPLYPHYAMSSYETAVVKVREVVAAQAPNASVFVQPPFFAEADYIEALYQSAKPTLDKGDFDMLLFSYHGIPERHLKQGDPSKTYCLVDKDCCAKKDPTHATCYRAQCFATTRAFVSRAGLEQKKWHVSFQSRLGREPWLKPYTDFELEALPGRDVKRIAVICPAFISDCLETLEEMALRGKTSFLEAGGESFEYIPCLNESALWIDVLERFIRDFESGALALE